MKRFHLFVASGLAALALVLVPSVALGFSLKSGDNVTVAKGETHRGSLYAAGQNITIDGDVDGDVWCAGNTITVNGSVRGDVLCAGQTVTINGPVEGNVRVAAQTVGINGTVGRNVSVASQTFTLGSSARVTGEVATLSQVGTINGSVGRDLYGAMESLTLAAAIEGSVDAHVDNLNVTSTGRVNGDLNYTSAKTASVGDDRVGGNINRHEPPKEQQPKDSPRDEFLGWVAGAVYWMLASLVIALLLIWLLPRAVRTVTGIMANRPGPSIGWGVVVMFVVPLAAFVLLFTLVGIPLALLAFGAWLLAWGVSGILVGIAAGRWILGRTDWQEARDSLVWAAVIGIPATILIFAIPILGWTLWLVATWWALGALGLSLREARA